MAGTFGAGTPFTQSSPWGISPYGSQGLSINPLALQQLHGQPFGSFPNPYATPPLQQIVQLLQIVPQQLQQLESLQLHQLQQLQQLQQLLQLVPQHLAQLQQLTQFTRSPHQSPQLQQPFGQILGLGSSPLPWGIPQVSGPQPGQVM
jgi:hypothetical protein